MIPVVFACALLVKTFLTGCSGQAEQRQGALHDRPRAGALYPGLVAQALQADGGYRHGRVFQDVAKLIQDTLDAYAGVKPDSVEGKMTMQLEDVYRQLQQVFAEGVHQSGENFRRAEKNTTGEGGVRYMSRDGIEMMSFLVPRGKKVNADLYIEDRHGLLLDDIRKHLPEIQSMSPVCDLDGTEFQKNESDTRSLKQKVKDFFDDIGNKVIREELGVIAINNAGAQDSLEHGYGPLKAACFAALPAVIEKGSMFGPIRYLERSYDTYLFVAPVRFVGTKNGEFYVGAYVIKDVNTTRYKIHEVLTISKEGNRLFQPEADQNGERLRNDSLPKGNVTQPETVVKPNSTTDSDGVKRSTQQKENATVADMLKKENEKLKADVDKLKELLKLQRTITGGTKFTESSVEAAARVLKKNAGATGNTAELASLLNSFYEYIATSKELTWEDVRVFDKI